MAEQVGINTVAKAMAGNDSALTAIYEVYQPKVHRFLYYRIGDPLAAEDLTTEVFLRVIENLPRYQIREVPLQAWIFQIARNLAIDYFRKQRVRNHQELDANFPSNHDGPDIVAARRMVSDQLRSALEQLTDGQSDVIILRFISGFSIAETAQTLSKSESAVKALQARGLEALSRVLSDQKVSVI